MMSHVVSGDLAGYQFPNLGVTGSNPVGVANIVGCAPRTGAGADGGDFQEASSRRTDPVLVVLLGERDRLDRMPLSRGSSRISDTTRRELRQPTCGRFGSCAFSLDEHGFGFLCSQVIRSEPEGGGHDKAASAHR